MYLASALDFDLTRNIFVSLNSPLVIKVYKILMGNGDMFLGVTSFKHPIQGRVAILLIASCYRL